MREKGVRIEEAQDRRMWRFENRTHRIQIEKRLKKHVASKECSESCTNLTDSVDICDVFRKSAKVVEQGHTVGEFQQLVFIILEEGHSKPEQHLWGWGKL